MLASKTSHLIRVVLLCLLVNVAVPLPVQSAQPTGPTEIFRGLSGEPCPNESVFTCVTLNVPLDHFNPSDPRRLPVTFAILPASGERKGIFVTAVNGPGILGIQVADSYTAALDERIPLNFDIVFFDQRGLGLSGGLGCPQAAGVLYLSEVRTDTPEGKAAFKATSHTFADACAAEGGRPELMPYLGTEQAVEDLEVFRQAMQAEKIWLYGEGYGTRYAQTYTAAHGEHVAGLVLDGTLDLTLDSFELYAQRAQAFNNTLVATLAACNADAGCARDLGGDAVGVYDALAARLKRSPLRLRFPLPSGGRADRQFTFTNLEAIVYGQMQIEGDRMLFLRALAAFAGRHDLAPMARLLYVTLGLDPETLEPQPTPEPFFSDLVHYAVNCLDYGFPGSTPDERAENYLRAGRPIDAAVPRLSTLFYSGLPCAFWPHARTNLSRPAPLTAEGIPTLVLGATADPLAPVNNGRDVFRHLDNGYLITQQGGPHVIFGRGNSCPDDLVTAFLVEDQPPERRKMKCEGVVVGAYVPLAPRDIRGFNRLVEAFISAETEINYLPEYYYWDGVAPTGVGCTHRGTLQFELADEHIDFALDSCTFSRGFAMTGAGSYEPGRDRFVLEVVLNDFQRCTLRYVRTGDRFRVTGKCGRQSVDLESSVDRSSLLTVSQGEADHK